MSCQICAENFNKSSRSKVACPYCAFESCTTCSQTYILGESSPKCMQPTCAKPWSREFLVETFTAKFVKTDLKKHTEQVLFDKERALLPATQTIVEEKIRKEKLSLEIAKIDKEIKALKERKDQLQTELYEGRRTTATTSQRNFVRACPDEHCRGFLDSQWKCGICANSTCKDCHIIINENDEEEHACHPDDVATATLLANDTKPCPSCGTGIFKIDGCDQMFCTECHTGFSWRTGNVETNLHNPHYFEWMRKGGAQAQGAQGQAQAPRNPNEILCGRELDRHFIESISRMTNDIKGEENKKIIKHKIMSIFETINHVSHVVRPRYDTDNVLNNQDLRIEYIMGKITPEQFKIKLQRANKNHLKKGEIGQLLGMFVSATTDILYRYRAGIENEQPQRKSDISFDTFIEIHNLIKYVNECLSKISATYSSVELQIQIREQGNRCHDVLLSASQSLKV